MLLANWLGSSYRGRSCGKTRQLESFAARNKKRSTDKQSRAIVAEVLEDRALLAASALGAELLANATTAGTQRTAASGGRSIAAAPDNSYVAVWTSSTGDGSGNAVYARRFAVDGT